MTSLAVKCFFALLYLNIWQNFTFLSKSMCVVQQLDTSWPFWSCLLELQHQINALQCGMLKIFQKYWLHILQELDINNLDPIVAPYIIRCNNWIQGCMQCAIKDLQGGAAAIRKGLSDANTDSNTDQKYRSEIQIRNTRNTNKNLDTNAVRNKGFIGRGSSDKEGAVRRKYRFKYR